MRLVRRYQHGPGVQVRAQRRQHRPDRVLDGLDKDPPAFTRSACWAGPASADAAHASGAASTVARASQPASPKQPQAARAHRASVWAHRCPIKHRVQCLHQRTEVVGSGTSPAARGPRASKASSDMSAPQMTTTAARHVRDGSAAAVLRHRPGEGSAATELASNAAEHRAAGALSKPCT
jgi:hypothetical protein